MQSEKYCGFAAELMQPIPRSVRVNGLSTCFRLEKIYWDIILEIAARENLSLGGFISQLDITIRLREGDLRNFSGFLRVMSTQYLAVQLDDALRRDIETGLLKGQ